MSVADFERFFYVAVLRDWEAEAEKMKRLLERFDAADTVHIVGEDTDLTISLAGRNGEMDEGKVNMPAGSSSSRRSRTRPRGRSSSTCRRTSRATP